MTTQQQNTTPNEDSTLEDLLGAAKPKAKKDKPVAAQVAEVEALVERVRAPRKAKKPASVAVVAKPKTLGDLMKNANAKAAAKRGGKKPAQAAAAPVVKGKAASKGGASAKAPAKPAKRARGNGQYSEYVQAAMGKIKTMKAGASLTTRELAAKHDIPPYAFLAAAHKLVNEEQVTLKNKNRINTITRL